MVKLVHLLPLFALIAPLLPFHRHPPDFIVRLQETISSCMMPTAGDADTPVAISDDQFAQLMAAIQASQQRFDNKFAEFCAEVRQGQEDAAVKAVK